MSEELRRPLFELSKIEGNQNKDVITGLSYSFMEILINLLLSEPDFSLRISDDDSHL